MTQESLAERMDVSLQMISNLELGKKAIRPENMVKLRRALGVSADYILFGKRSGEELSQLLESYGRLPSDIQCIIAQLIEALS